MPASHWRAGSIYADTVLSFVAGVDTARSTSMPTAAPRDVASTTGFSWGWESPRKTSHDDSGERDGTSDLQNLRRTPVARPPLHPCAHPYGGCGATPPTDGDDCQSSGANVSLTAFNIGRLT